MRRRALVIVMTAAAVTWQVFDVAGAARCSYLARYPAAVGRHTFLLATATGGTVMAAPNAPPYSSLRTVPAQVMVIDDVAGYDSEVIRRGLRASGGTAAFVRYHIAMTCGPFPARDGALDSAGVNGLYVGVPRPEHRWLDGRPTFDIFRAAHYPLPQRLSGPSGHLVFTEYDSTPSMTAPELFTMYRGLWAESVSVGDTSVERRIRNWLASNPRTARKQPVKQVAMDMLSAVTDARIAAHPVPFGGTFAITVVVPGVDSLVMYGQSSSKARLWIGDVIRDTITGVPVTIIPGSFAVDVRTAMSLEGFARSSMRINPCPPIPIIVDDLPIVPDADSSWRGEMRPNGFVACAPPGSVPTGLREAMRFIDPGKTYVTFRRHSDGRVTFDAQATRAGSPWMRVRGVRVPGVPDSAPFD